MSLRDKDATFGTADSVPGSPHNYGAAPPIDEDVDEAYEFPKQTSAASEEAGVIDDVKLRRKVDWHILPVLFISYMFFFLDKAVVNYAAVMGFETELKLTGNDFSNSSSAFSMAYLIAQLLHGFMLNKFPAAKYLTVVTILWGVTCAATAAATDYNTLVIARVFVGIFEGATAPCVTLPISQWFTRKQQSSRFAIWFCGFGFGQLVSGLLSYGFQHVHDKSFAGWKALFVCTGCATILTGVATFFLVPDSPMSAKFLSSAEKAAILKEVASNRTGVVNHHFKPSQIVEMLTDFQLWCLAVIMILTCIPSGAISTYSATLIKNFGYNSRQSALLNTPSGAAAIVGTLAAGYAVRLTNCCAVLVIACCLPAILGGGLMSFLPKHNKAGLLAGIYLVNTVTPVLPLVFQWTANNVAGHTKRTFSVSLMAASYSIGAIIGPQTFQAKDAPQYIPAKITILAVQSGAVLLASVLYIYYTVVNKRRDSRHGIVSSSVDATDEENWANWTDKQNPSFRYVR